MHEFGIGQELVAAVVTELARFSPPPHVQKVRVVVGGLRQVIPDNLLFAYEVLSRDTPAAGSALEIEILPLRGECTDCGWQGEITLPVFQCGSCGAYAVRTLGGMELYLDSLEIEGERCMDEMSE